MPVHSIDHFNLRASEQESLVLRDFYCNVVGLALGPRPPLASSGFWLYADGVPVIHLTIAPAEESLPEVADRRSAANHLALRCTDFDAAVARLNEHGVKHRIAQVPLLNQQQIFLHDPSGFGVELNFPSTDVQ